MHYKDPRLNPVLSLRFKVNNLVMQPLPPHNEKTRHKSKNKISLGKSNIQNSSDLMKELLIDYVQQYASM